MYYEIKIATSKVDEKTGKEKKVKLNYLVQDKDFAYAVLNLSAELDKENINYRIISATEKNYEEIVCDYDEQEEYFYIARIEFDDVDGKDGKRLHYNVVINTVNIYFAKEICEDICLQHGDNDAKIASLKESPIVEFFKYYE